MKRIAWFKLRRLSGGLYAPFVTVTLGLASKTSGQMDFLVDSGASRSLVPRNAVFDLLSREEAPPEAASSLQDASGKPLKGLDIDFDVAIVGAGRLPVVRERILVGRDIKWAVLGMSWFEKTGVHFQNFPERPGGRQFALYTCPF